MDFYFLSREWSVARPPALLQAAPCPAAPVLSTLSSLSCAFCRESADCQNNIVVYLLRSCKYFVINTSARGLDAAVGVAKTQDEDGSPVVGYTSNQQWTATAVIIPGNRKQ